MCILGRNAPQINVAAYVSPCRDILDGYYINRDGIYEQLFKEVITETTSKRISRYEIYNIAILTLISIQRNR